MFLNISEFQAANLKRLCQWQNLRLQVEHSSPMGAVEDSVALTALITMAGAYIMHTIHINYSSCNSNLLCCRVSKHQKKRRKTLSKQCWDAGFHQPRTLHVSCSTVARTETHLPEPSQPNAANFFHLSVETIFHVWHLCWLSILSVNLIPDPPPSRFFSHTHWIHKQDWTRSVQGSISCPVGQQIIFLSHISAWGYIADNS